MKEEECELSLKIDKMRFVGIDDLFVKKQSIRERYENLTFFEKEVYKWYFFHELCLLKWKNQEKQSLKETFWEYLNGKTSSKEVNKLYVEFCEYRDDATI